MPGKHQHFQDPEVGCCGKYFLFGFNIVFWVSAGSASRPALGRGTRQPQFLGGGRPSSGACDRGLSPIPSTLISSPQELLSGSYWDY